MSKKDFLILRCQNFKSGTIRSERCFFCAIILLVKYIAATSEVAVMPSRFSLLKYLTARRRLFLLVKTLRVMKEEKKSQLIAEAENVEAIRDFFNHWYAPFPTALW